MIEFKKKKNIPIKNISSFHFLVSSPFLHFFHSPTQFPSVCPRSRGVRPSVCLLIKVNHLLIKVCTYIVWSTLKIRNLACWTRTDRLGELSIGCNVETHGGIRYVNVIEKTRLVSIVGIVFFFFSRDHRAKDLEET